jgi:hypothetical protein
MNMRAAGAIVALGIFSNAPAKQPGDSRHHLAAHARAIAGRFCGGLRHEHHVVEGA